MAFNNIRAVFVDIDDTLWWFSKNSQTALELTFSKFNLAQWSSFERFHQLYLVQNKALWEKYHHGLIDKTTLLYERFSVPLVQIGCPHISEAFIGKLNDFYLSTLSSLPDLMPWGRELLEYLSSKGYQINAVSNGFISTQERKLNAAGVRHFISHLIISEEVGYTKPMKEIFDIAVSQCGCLPCEVVMIGDNFDADIKGARNAGWHTIFFNPNGKPSGPEAEATVSSLDQVVNYL